MKRALFALFAALSLASFGCEDRTKRTIEVETPRGERRVEIETPGAKVDAERGKGVEVHAPGVDVEIERRSP